MRRVSIALGFSAGLFVTGCGALARDTVKTTVPVAVESAVDKATAADTQKMIAERVDPKYVQETSAKLLSGVVDGSLDSLGQPERRAELRQVFSELLAGFQLPLTIQGIDKNAVGDIVDELVRRAFSSDSDKAKLVLRAAVQEIVAAAFEQVRHELEGQEIGKGLSAGAREMAKEATLGFQEAIDETAQKKRAGQLGTDEGNVLDAANRAAQSSSSVVPIAIAGFGGFALAVLGAILWAGRRRRITRSDLASRDEALLAMVDVIRASEGKPWSRELQQIVRDTIHDRENVDHLRQLLRKQSGAAPPRAL